MIHARRVKAKENSARERLEQTSIGFSGQVLASNLVSNLASGNAVSSSAVSSAAAKDTQQVGAFDEAFGSRKRRVGSRSKTSSHSRHSSRNGNGGRSKVLKRLILLAIALILLFILLSLTLRVETINIEGNNYLDTMELQSLSKIQTGTPLLWVSERNVKNLLRNPWLDNVKINRVFPNTVNIELRERAPVAVLSRELTQARLSSTDMAAETRQEITQIQNDVIAYAADGTVLPDIASIVPATLVERLAVIDGWGVDRTVEGLELLNFLSRTPELSISNISYTPEGFEASFEYGLQDSFNTTTSFILGQLQTPSLTLLKEHWSEVLHALATREGVREAVKEANALGGSDMAGSSEGVFFVPVPDVGTSDLGTSDLDQETRRIVKRKYVTVYGWGVSLSE